MAEQNAAAIVSGIRQAIQDVLAPDLREMREDIWAIRERLDGIDKRFDRMEDQMSTYRDVQMLKEQMAELRAR